MEPCSTQPQASICDYTAISSVTPVGIPQSYVSMETNRGNSGLNEGPFLYNDAQFLDSLSHAGSFNKHPLSASLPRVRH